MQDRNRKELTEGRHQEWSLRFNFRAHIFLSNNGRDFFWGGQDRTKNARIVCCRTLSDYQLDFFHCSHPLDTGEAWTSRASYCYLSSWDNLFQLEFLFDVFLKGDHDIQICQRNEAFQIVFIAASSGNFCCHLSTLSAETENHFSKWHCGTFVCPCLPTCGTKVRSAKATDQTHKAQRQSLSNNEWVQEVPEDLRSTVKKHRWASLRNSRTPATFQPTESPLRSPR